MATVTTRHGGSGPAHDVTPVEARPTRYEMCLLPEDNINSLNFTIAVEYRGDGRWAVLHHGWTLTVDGEWEYEPRPSGREDDYLARCRFDLGTALALARKALPDLRVNGHSAQDTLRVAGAS